VLELGVLMWVLISWHFAAAEFIGGPIMIAVLVCWFALNPDPGFASNIDPPFGPVFGVR
jgi:multisubunit Na+/H+ antiporter MnhE subunit